MKIQAQVLNSRGALDKMSTRALAVVFSFRPGIKDLLQAVQRSKALKTIYVAPSYYATVSKSASVMLKEMDVELKTTPLSARTGKSVVWGGRTDISAGWVEIEEGDN
jgi:hypothetical protein